MAEQPKSKFGGVPVDELAATSKFGGVPVMDNTQESKPGPTSDPLAGIRGTRPLTRQEQGIDAQWSDAHPGLIDRGVHAVLGPLVNSATALGRGMKNLVSPTDESRTAALADTIEGGGGMALPFALPSLAARPVSALAGGLIGMGAQKAGGSVAHALGASSDTERLVGDVSGAIGGPLASTAAGGAPRALAGVLGKRAMGITGRMERYGANPVRELFEHTSAVRPEDIANEAHSRIANRGRALTDVANEAGKTLPPDQWPDLTPARRIGTNAITAAKAGNDLFAPNEMNPLVKQLSEPQPGFKGVTTYPPGAHSTFSITTPQSSILGPNGQPLSGTPVLTRGTTTPPLVAPKQPPSDFLRMKRRFGEQFTKFDSGRPLTDETIRVGNEMYGSLANEFNSKVPGAAPINQELQGLIPLERSARQVSMNAGPGDRIIDRFTRPTGGLVAPLMAFGKGGPLGAAAMITAQELMASPTAKMVAARPLYGFGNGLRTIGARSSGLVPLAMRGSQ